jgi:hypothetical protein
VRSLCVAFGFLASTALGADPRVTLLSKQLTTTKDPRVRAQTVLLLGQTGSEDAVPPLCMQLKDAESIVRAAAANALGELRLESATTCLKSALGEPDASVRAAMEKALSTPSLQKGALYLHIEPISGGLDTNLVSLADGLLKSHLSTMGATFAPAGEEKKAAQALIKSRALRGFQVRMQLAPGEKDKQLKVEMLIMTYPEQALQGSWNVKASGGKPESLIKAMVPKVIDDAAGDLNWKSP